MVMNGIDEWRQRLLGSQYNYASSLIGVMIDVSMTTKLAKASMSSTTSVTK